MWWWLIVLPPLACLAASPFNPAFLIAALIWVLLLLPPAVMAVYFSILLRPSVAVMTRPHTVTLAPEALTVVFPTPDAEEEDADPSAPLAPVSIPDGAVTSIREVAGYIVVTWRDDSPSGGRLKRRSYLLIPVGLLTPESLRLLAAL